MLQPVVNGKIWRQGTLSDSFYRNFYSWNLIVADLFHTPKNASPVHYGFTFGVQRKKKKKTGKNTAQYLHFLPKNIKR